MKAITEAGPLQSNFVQNLRGPAAELRGGVPPGAHLFRALVKDGDMHSASKSAADHTL